MGKWGKCGNGTLEQTGATERLEKWGMGIEKTAQNRENWQNRDTEINRIWENGEIK